MEVQRIHMGLSFDTTISKSLKLSSYCTDQFGLLFETPLVSRSSAGKRFCKSSV